MSDKSEKRGAEKRPQLLEKIENELNNSKQATDTAPSTKSQLLQETEAGFAKFLPSKTSNDATSKKKSDPCGATRVAADFQNPIKLYTDDHSQDKHAYLG